MKHMALEIILASSSPRRSMLLREAGYRFQVVPSAANELEATAEDVHDIVVENARIKGSAVLARLADQPLAVRTPPTRNILLAADTLVVKGQRVYGKPRDLDEAESFLHELGGVPHEVLTGVFLYDLDHGRQRAFWDTTSVVLKKMDSAEIRRLFARVTPLDKAGGYGFQDAREIVAEMHGDETNVIGLPMIRTKHHLEALLQQDD